MCAAGLVAIWYGVPRLATSLQHTLESLDRTLESTNQLLAVTRSTLDTLDSQVTIIERASQNIASSIETTSAIADDFASLSGRELPSLVESLQTSLGAMESSARLVDDTLSFIGMLPLIGARYTPEVPLSQTVAGVSSDLDTLNPVFTRMKGNMQTAAADLKSLKQDVEELTKSLDNIQSSIAVVQGAVSDYQAKVTALRQRLNDLHQRLPAYLATAATAVTLAIIWLAVVLIATFLQGRQLMMLAIVSPAVE